MNLTVYKSSAGSGKTYTLVKEYLVQVLKKPDKYNEILALTFTNKASAEMKSRILDYLEKIANSSETEVSVQLVNDLVQKTGLNSDRIIKNARTVLLSLLHNYSDFAVKTIDSFAHRIVKTFSYDLFLPMNFEVEKDTEVLVRKSVELLINKVGMDDMLTKILVDFTENKTEEEKSWNIEYDLLKISETLFWEDSNSRLEKLATFSLKHLLNIRNQLLKYNKNFENLLQENAHDALQLIKSRKLDIKIFFNTDKGIIKFFKDFSEKHFENFSINKLGQKTITKNKWLNEKASDSEKREFEAIKQGLIEIYTKITDLIKKYSRNYILNTIIIKNYYSLILLNEVKKILEELKKQANIIFISDFNKQIAGIVLNEPVPYIYERIGEKFRNYFIDEFQDTSVIQWQNLLPLVDNSLSNGEFNLIVGDGKQAIYRWRNGKVEQFNCLPELICDSPNQIIADRESNLKRNYKEELLNTNFRSGNEIVEFNNSFFEIIKKQMPAYVRSVYNNHKQTAHIKNKSGFVSVEFIENANNSPISFFETSLNRILALIIDLNKDGFGYSDIAIICRSNKNVSDIARFLINHNINVVCSESSLIKSSAEVMFVIACIRLINNDKELISFITIIQYLISNSRFGFTDDIYDSIKIENETNNIAEIFNKRLQKSGVSFDRKVLKKMMMYELCEEIIRTFRLNNRKDPYLIAFLDAVSNYCIKNHNNLSDFLEWWDKKSEKLSISFPEGINAVKILTIHKAKGLEYPVVIFPFANWKIDYYKTIDWIDLEKDKFQNLPAALIKFNKELCDTDFAYKYNEEVEKILLDELNLLYVVFTRPTQRLYVLSEQKKNNQQLFHSEKKISLNNISDLLYQFIEEKKFPDFNKHIYTFGEAAKYVSSHSSSNNTAYFSDSLISAKTSDKLFIKTTDFITYPINDYNKNILWGNIFHMILSRIYTTDDIKSAVDVVFKNELFPEKYKKTVTNKIERLLHLDLVKPFFNKGLKVLNETELISRNGKILRPDRIVFTENSLTIIDYKTGIVNENHKTQIKEYAEVLESMLYKVEKKLLIQITNEQVFEIQ